MNPYVDNNKSGSSMDQSIHNLETEQNKEALDLDLALGKVPPQDGGRYLLYTRITHPYTGKEYSIYSKKGKTLLQTYFNSL